MRSVRSLVQLIGSVPGCACSTLALSDCHSHRVAHVFVYSVHWQSLTQCQCEYTVCSHCCSFSEPPVPRAMLSLLPVQCSAPAFSVCLQHRPASWRLHRSALSQCLCSAFVQCLVHQCGFRFSACPLGAFSIMCSRCLCHNPAGIARLRRLPFLHRGIALSNCAVASLRSLSLCSTVSLQHCCSAP